MINRLLIRIKATQLVYAYLQSEQPRYMANEALLESVEASQKLYNYLLALIVKVTDYRRAQIEQARNKYLATAEDLNPNTRFTDNQIPALISRCSEVIDYCEREQLTSDFDTDLYRSLLADIEELPLYQEYMSQTATPTFEQDRTLWLEILNQVIPNSERLDEALESKNIVWNDDLTTILQVVVKTVSKLTSGTEAIDAMQTFRNDDDRKFAQALLQHAIEDYYENVRLINAVAPNWESNRMMLMDKVIMSTALAEIKHFPDIAVAISINEYLELAKHYCSANSAKFINGVLDKIVKEWRANKVIIKP